MWNHCSKYVQIAHKLLKKLVSITCIYLIVYFLLFFVIEKNGWDLIGLLILRGSPLIHLEKGLGLSPQSYPLALCMCLHTVYSMYIQSFNLLLTYFYYSRFKVFCHYFLLLFCCNFWSLWYKSFGKRVSQWRSQYAVVYCFLSLTSKNVSCWCFDFESY